MEIDRNQVNRYAIASSTGVDFEGEAIRCASIGKKKDNERYCFVYPTEEAFRASKVQENGDQDPVCWVAFAGNGTGEDKITSVQGVPRSSYDLEKRCPAF